MKILNYTTIVALALSLLGQTLYADTPQQAGQPVRYSDTEQVTFRSMRNAVNAFFSENLDTGDYGGHKDGRVSLIGRIVRLKYELTTGPAIDSASPSFKPGREKDLKDQLDDANQKLSENIRKALQDIAPIEGATESKIVTQERDRLTKLLNETVTKALIDSPEILRATKDLSDLEINSRPPAYYIAIKKANNMPENTARDKKAKAAAINAASEKWPLTNKYWSDVSKARTKVTDAQAKIFKDFELKNNLKVWAPAPTPLVIDRSNTYYTLIGTVVHYYDPEKHALVPDTGHEVQRDANGTTIDGVKYNYFITVDGKTQWITMNPAPQTSQVVSIDGRYYVVNGTQFDNLDNDPNYRIDPDGTLKRKGPNDTWTAVDVAVYVHGNVPPPVKPKPPTNGDFHVVQIGQVNTLFPKGTIRIGEKPDLSQAWVQLEIPLACKANFDLEEAQNPPPGVAGYKVMSRTANGKTAEECLEDAKKEGISCTAAQHLKNGKVTNDVCFALIKYTKETLVDGTSFGLLGGQFAENDNEIALVTNTSPAPITIMTQEGNDARQLAMEQLAQKNHIKDLYNQFEGCRGSQQDLAKSERSLRELIALKQFKTPQGRAYYENHKYDLCRSNMALVADAAEKAQSDKEIATATTAALALKTLTVAGRISCVGLEGWQSDIAHIQKSLATKKFALRGQAKSQTAVFRDVENRLMAAKATCGADVACQAEIQGDLNELNKSKVIVDFQTQGPGPAFYKDYITAGWGNRCYQAMTGQIGGIGWGDPCTGGMYGQMISACRTSGPEDYSSFDTCTQARSAFGEFRSVPQQLYTAAQSNQGQQSMMGIAQSLQPGQGGQPQGRPGFANGAVGFGGQNGMGGLGGGIGGIGGQGAMGLNGFPGPGGPLNGAGGQIPLSFGQPQAGFGQQQTGFNNQGMMPQGNAMFGAQNQNPGRFALQ